MVLSVDVSVTCTPGRLEALFADPELGRCANEVWFRAFAERIGGVRISDIITVTETGVELLAEPPRALRDVERAMAGDWP